MDESIHSTFSQHHAEIQRRAEVTQRGHADDRTFSKVSDAQDFEFDNPNQKFIVFSLSHEGFAPLADNVRNPAICIYGAFSTREEAVEYARDSVLCEHPGISIMVDESHKWVVGVCNPVHLADVEHVEKQRTRLLKAHERMLNINAKEFEENVVKQCAGTAGKKEENRIEDVTDKARTTKSHKISSRLDVRGQKLVALSFVRDDADIPEFLVRVYGFFEREDEANAYIRNVCGDKVQDYDIDVVSTCEWIFPQKMTYDKANREVFRSDELDVIMRTHKNQPKEVAKFQNDMKEREALEDIPRATSSDDSGSVDVQEGIKGLPENE